MNRDAERALWGFTAAELVGVAAVLVLVASGLFGDGSFLSDVGRPLRLALLSFLAVELLGPVWVFLDVRRRGIDRVWVHVTAMPVVNVFGLLAYLAERKRRSA